MASAKPPSMGVTLGGRSVAEGQPETAMAEDEVVDEDEEELKKALALSKQDMEVEDEEADLRRAIQLSMQGTKSLY